MDVVVTGRHCELSDRFRGHVTEKLSRLEKHDHRIIRVQVEVEQERNPRQADRAVRVELTAFSKGPVIRAEAAAEEKMGALDLALDKMAAQMRRAADRRREHKHKHDRVADLLDAGLDAGPAADDAVDTVRQVGPITVTGEGPLVVREAAAHRGEPSQPIRRKDQNDRQGQKADDERLLFDREERNQVGGGERHGEDARQQRAVRCPLSLAHAFKPAR